MMMKSLFFLEAILHFIIDLPAKASARTSDELTICIMQANANTKLLNCYNLGEERSRSPRFPENENGEKVFKLFGGLQILPPSDIR